MHEEDYKVIANRSDRSDLLFRLDNDRNVKAAHGSTKVEECSTNCAYPSKLAPARVMVSFWKSCLSSSGMAGATSPYSSFHS